MEDYEYTVIKLHAIYSTIVCKVTGNISKNTSKSTSETDQIRLRGGPWGGLPPLREPLPDCILAPIPGVHQENRIVGKLWKPHSQGSAVRPSMSLTRPCETCERPMRDFRREINGYPFTTFDSFPTFLGELDSRYQSFITLLAHTECMFFFQESSSRGITSSEV